MTFLNKFLQALDQHPAQLGTDIQKVPLTQLFDLRHMGQLHQPTVPTGASLSHPQGI